ncbi:hypothetical protein K7432_017447 [Basidiobolus ranarum]|uniref:Uncharacterized protein n=1 Tax=Basidiobolus ranarum TaxID=34480 RepID=A0ABR2VKL1_9FUNG
MQIIMHNKEHWDVFAGHEKDPSDPSDPSLLESYRRRDKQIVWSSDKILKNEKSNN